MLKTVLAAFVLVTGCATDEEDVNLDEIEVPTEEDHVDQDRGADDAIPNPPQLKKLTRVPGNTNDNVQEVGPVGTQPTVPPEPLHDADVEIEPTIQR